MAIESYGVASGEVYIVLELISAIYYGALRFYTNFRKLPVWHRLAIRVCKLSGFNHNVVHVCTSKSIGQLRTCMHAMNTVNLTFLILLNFVWWDTPPVRDCTDFVRSVLKCTARSNRSSRCLVRDQKAVGHCFSEIVQLRDEGDCPILYYYHISDHWLKRPAFIVSG